MRPPAKTPAPVLIRRAPKAQDLPTIERDGEKPVPKPEARTGAGSAAEPIVEEQAVAVRLVSIPPVQLPLDLSFDEVPDLRPRPRPGFVLALIGTAALAVGAFTALLVKQLDVEVPEPVPAVVETDRSSAAVVTELPNEEQNPAAAIPVAAIPVAATPVAGPQAERPRTRSQARPDLREDRKLSNEIVTEPGYLTVDAAPYATIFVDGNEVGDTPIIRHELPPGKHRVEAVSSDGGSDRFAVHIESGETTRRRLGPPR